MIIEEGCFYYRTDRPCIYHKATGQECAECPHRRPVDERILLIKLAAMGDVLRTTALLAPLERKYPRGSITWLVGEESAPLLENNPYLREIWRLGPETTSRLQVEEFDLCINLDLGPDSLAFASAARAQRKMGYGLGPHGNVIRYNPEAEEWYRMSHLDPLKKANRKTYQAHMLGILGLDETGSSIIVNCPPEEQEYARNFLEKRVPDRGKTPVIGFNLGGGGRWKRKRWPLDSFRLLGEKLSREENATVLLLYGKDEEEDARRIPEESLTPIVDTGSGNSLPRFAAFINLCDVVVTGDTLALHMALGLKRRVVALFGPTSPHEIEMYGLGTKITADIECLGCYQETCGQTPNCMEGIAVDTVFEHVCSELGRLEQSRQESLHVR